jgi:predicted Na+-dependent transporter
MRKLLHTCLAGLKKDWFLVGMVSAVILASFFPDWGRSGGITLSGLLGIVMTPLLVASFAGVNGHSISLGESIIGIARLLMLPLVLGQLLRPLLHEWHHKHKRYTTLLDRGVILMLV